MGVPLPQVEVQRGKAGSWTNDPLGWSHYSQCGIASQGEGGERSLGQHVWEIIDLGDRQI